MGCYALIYAFSTLRLPVMQQYHGLLQHILDKGVITPNRTSTPAKKVFGYQMRFDLREGFPLVTTKRLNIKAIVHELIWFLRGDTNIQYLTDNGVTIWDEWALTEDQTIDSEIPYQLRVELYAKKVGITSSQAFDKMHDLSLKGFKFALVELEAAGIPMHDTVVVRKKGELGPIYGEQWRSWDTGRIGADGQKVCLDQIAGVVETLRNNPNSRRIIVSAWNPAVLPDESIGPQDNVRKGNQALAACHTMFQFATMPLTLDERWSWVINQVEIGAAQVEGNEAMRAWYEVNCGKMWTGQEDIIHDELNRLNVPRYSLNLQLYQRSADSFLGVPFNIASYALFLAMVAQVTNMIAGDFVHTLGDAHIYTNHVEAIELQLSRDHKPLPKLWLNPQISEIDEFGFDDIRVVEYEAHPSIKGAVAV
jgi:thymidylate synthase